ncbi:MAG: Protein-export protein SecB [Proteobacteria bacterium]|nr:MAG: Protein-export protein SecB [Pseudomonadota bacterium]
MTDATQKKEEHAMFNIVGQFAKDISLECAVPPFAKESEGLNMQMDVGIGVRPLDKEEGAHEVVLKLRGEAKNKEEVSCYLAEVEYAGVFQVKNVTDEQLTPLLSIDGAALLFRFARQVLMNLISDAGYRAPMIAPVNFHAMYVQAQQSKEAKTA